MGVRTRFRAGRDTAASSGTSAGARRGSPARHVVELDEHDDGYAGPAELLVSGTRLEVSVRLGGFFQPIDGRYHWYGRVEAHAGLAALVNAKTSVVLQTPHGPADAVLADPDLWGRYRVTGTGSPPFAVPSELDA